MSPLGVLGQLPQRRSRQIAAVRLLLERPHAAHVQRAKISLQHERGRANQEGMGTAVKVSFMQLHSTEQVATWETQASLFPPGAPAGWVASGRPKPVPNVPGPRSEKRSNRTPGGETRAGDLENRRRAHTKVRDLAAQLFENAINDEFSPPEAADLVVHSESYLEARKNLIAWCEKLPFPRVDNLVARKCFPSTLWLVSHKLGSTLEHAIQIKNATMRASRRLQQLPDVVRPSVSVEEMKRDPLWFLSDPELPDVVVRAMLASHRSYAMQAALDGLIHRRRLDLVLAKNAAALWLQASHRYLVLLASIPGTEVPAQLVPDAERFDLIEAIEKQTRLISALTHAA